MNLLGYYLTFIKLGLSFTPFPCSIVGRLDRSTISVNLHVSGSDPYQSQLDRGTQGGSAVAGVKKGGVEKFGRPCGKAKCGPCARCGRTGFSFFMLGHYKMIKLKIGLKQNARFTDTDCICKACKVSVSKKQQNPNYTPEKSHKKIPVCSF